MAGHVTDPLISAGDAIALIGSSVFIEATWATDVGLPPGSDARIPGSLTFDFDAIKDTENPLPHMLPSPAHFAQHMSELGITANDPLIIYDRIGLFLAPRVWWMLRTMGHANIRVLDGGMPAWLAAGGDSANAGETLPAPQMATYAPDFQPARIRNFEDVLNALEDKGILIVDVRSATRFSGSVPEPRPELASGHMPGAHNAPFTELLNADGTMRPESELRGIFAKRGVSLDQPIITSCGSGVTACITALALARLGVDAAVYDGSWTEWGSRPGAPVVTG